LHKRSKINTPDSGKRWGIKPLRTNKTAKGVEDAKNFSCFCIHVLYEGYIYSVYSILEQKTHKRLTDLLEVHFLNLSAVQEYPIKKPASTDKRQKLVNWLRFIATDNKEERAMIATISEEQFNAGLQEGKLEAARLMKAEALAPDLIVKITGLSKEEVEALN